MIQDPAFQTRIYNGFLFSTLLHTYCSPDNSSASALDFTDIKPGSWSTLKSPLHEGGPPGLNPRWHRHSLCG